MGEPTEMDLIKSQIHEMAEKSEKRMDRLEELLSKLASASSNANENENASLDENGNPRNPSKEGEVDSTKTKNTNTFGFAYNNSPNNIHVKTILVIHL